MGLSPATDKTEQVETLSGANKRQWPILVPGTVTSASFVFDVQIGVIHSRIGCYMHVCPHKNTVKRASNWHYAIEFIPLHDILHVAKLCFVNGSKWCAKEASNLVSLSWLLARMPTKREDGLPSTDPRERVLMPCACCMQMLQWDSGANALTHYDRRNIVEVMPINLIEPPQTTDSHCNFLRIANTGEFP